jgi:hypothetical protein
MSKRTSLLFFFFNAFFLVANMMFLLMGMNIELHFLSALVSLGGLVASWLIYSNGEE